MAVLRSAPKVADLVYDLVEMQAAKCGRGCSMKYLDECFKVIVKEVVKDWSVTGVMAVSGDFIVRAGDAGSEGAYSEGEETESEGSWEDEDMSSDHG